MLKSAIKISAALLLLTACNELVFESQQMGSITLSLSSDIEVDAQTKAASVDCSDFIVSINGTTLMGSPYSSESLYKDMTGLVPFGSYVLSAQSCTEKTALEANSGLGCVRYAGESGTVSVRSEESVPVTITCHMVNAKASIYLDESFTADFTDITASLSVDKRTVTVIDQKNTTGGQEVYFNVPQSGASLVYTVTGKIGEKTLTYTNASSPMLLKAAKWAKITIKSNHNGNIGIPDIDVDDTMDDNHHTEYIDPENGSGLVDGSMDFPSIFVDTYMHDATVIDCVLEVK